MAPVTEDILGCHIFVIKRTCKIKVLFMKSKVLTINFQNTLLYILLIYIFHYIIYNSIEL